MRIVEAYLQYGLPRPGISLDGASDHGVSEALYLHDPDNNGIELYWDRPAEEWPHSSGSELAMYTRRLIWKGCCAKRLSPYHNEEIKRSQKNTTKHLRLRRFHRPEIDDLISGVEGMA